MSQVTTEGPDGAVLYQALGRLIGNLESQYRDYYEVNANKGSAFICMLQDMARDEKETGVSVADRLRNKMESINHELLSEQSDARKKVRHDKEQARQQDKHLAEIEFFISCSLCLKALAEVHSGDSERAWETLTEANLHLGMSIGIYAVIEVAGYRNPHETLAEIARRGGVSRHANDPKQSEKAFVYDCWTAWKVSPSNYKSKAGFARDMLSKCEYLTSQKKIEDWCREWEADK